MSAAQRMAARREWQKWFDRACVELGSLLAEVSDMPELPELPDNMRETYASVVIAESMTNEQRGRRRS